MVASEALLTADVAHLLLVESTINLIEELFPGLTVRESHLVAAVQSVPIFRPIRFYELELLRLNTIETLIQHSVQGGSRPAIVNMMSLRIMNYED